MIEIAESKRDQILNDFVLDLTPLLDVIFMLVVFLLLAANLTSYAIKVDLVRGLDGHSVVQAQAELLSITVYPEEKGWEVNEIFYQTEEAFKNALLAENRQNHPVDKVVVICDRKVSVERFLYVLSFLRKHDIQIAEILVQKEKLIDAY